jgi:hypothetical protein
MVWRPLVRTPDRLDRKRELGLTEWLAIAQLVLLIVGAIASAVVFVLYDAKDRNTSHLISQAELEKRNAKPVKLDQAISIWKFSANSSNSDYFGVSYDYTITNRTNQQIRVAMVVLHELQMATPDPTKSPFDHYFVPDITLNDPESPWRRLSSRAYLADGETVEEGVVKYSDEGFSVIPEKESGGGTGELEAGENAWGSTTMFVKGNSLSIVGFQVDIDIRLKDESLKRMRIFQFAALKPGDYSGSPSIASRRDGDY